MEKLKIAEIVIFMLDFLNIGALIYAHYSMVGKAAGTAEYIYLSSLRTTLFVALIGCIALTVVFKVVTEYFNTTKEELLERIAKLERVQKGK